MWALASSFFYPFYYQHPIAFQWQVAILVAKAIHIAFFVAVLVGEILKIETRIHQLLPRAFAQLFAGRYQAFEYAAVAAQHGIYFFDDGRVFRFQLVVVLGTAVVVAKFFVDAALDGFAAAKALFRCGLHASK